MTIRRFKIICRFLSIILQVLTALSVLMIFGSIFIYLFTTNGSISFEPTGFRLYSSQSRFIDDHIFERAAFFVSPISLIMYMYVFSTGSQLFEKLYKGYSPFTDYFVRRIKQLSYVLIGVGFLSSSIYSLAVTLIAENASYLSLTLGSDFVLGLILYVVAETFNYGIELQTLSDETV